MKTILIWIFSFLFAGTIISPFFWLKFLKEKSRWGYVLGSLITSLAVFIFSIVWLYDFILRYIHTYDALDYFDGISIKGVLIVIFLVIISPFIFTKIVYGSFKIKSILISLASSVLIFVSLFLFWAYVLIPKAFGEFLKHF